jgi:hypothetical protein
MKNYGYIKKAFIGTSIAAVVLFCAAVSTGARSVTDEYAKWQKAKAHAEARYTKYQASGSSHDYKKWQHALSHQMKHYSRITATAFDTSDLATTDTKASETTPIPPITKEVQTSDVSNQDDTFSTKNNMTADEPPVRAEPVTEPAQPVTDDPAKPAEPVIDSAPVVTVETAKPAEPPIEPASPVTDDLAKPTETVVEPDSHVTGDDPAIPAHQSSESVTAPADDYDLPAETANMPVPTVSDDLAVKAEPVSDLDSTVAKDEDSAAMPLSGKIMVDDKEIDIETGRNTVNTGFMYGYKRGEKDRKHGHDFDSKVTVPYRDATQPSVIPSGRYKRYYEAGYTRGYEDGFNNTSKYGTVSKNGYSMHGSAVDAVMGSMGSKTSDTAGSMDEL